jgi:RNA polymerase sigma-70 factor (ECF subfamily)
VQGVEPEVLEQAEGSVRGPLESMISDEQKAALYRGLDRLKPLDRATLAAFYLRGQSLVQMAREFDTPIGTIKRRLHVARLRLKRQLEGAAAEGTDDVKARKPRRERELACV